MYLNTKGNIKNFLQDLSQMCSKNILNKEKQDWIQKV